MLSRDPEAPKVLVLEDEPIVRRGTARLLAKSGYEVIEAGETGEARTLLQQTEVDLVLCDINLPGQSGLSFMNEIIRLVPDVAIVMVTGLDDPEVAQVALEQGAFGYVIKPFERNELIIGVASALRRRSLQIENERYRNELEGLVRERTENLRKSREELIRRLSCAADYKDTETAAHIDRMSRYAELLARRAGLPSAQCEAIRVAAPMHDIGKIGIPDAVLTKPGRYTDEDRAIMQRHPEIGYSILQGSDSELIQMGAVVALTHHEWFDGSGYPAGLKGTDIPIEGRIVAIADVFDALTTKRCYKDPMTFEEAQALMQSESGTHFDPLLVELFFRDVEEIEEIRASSGLEIDLRVA